ncbi:TspO/MBR family protein [Aphelenchoides avenae]|nr:TspO/MBR family protein [Aphelenchus avenae]
MTGLPHEVRRLGNSLWTSEDTRNSLMTSLIPAAAGWVVFAKDREYAEICSFAPEWVPREAACYQGMDLLTMAPVGYATYLVYKYGGGFDYRDTAIALGLYGGMALLDLATAAVVDIKTRNHKAINAHSSTKFLVTAATAYSYYKVYEHAGYWMIPITLWSGFRALCGWSLIQNNDLKIE